MRISAAHGLLLLLTTIILPFTGSTETRGLAGYVRCETQTPSSAKAKGIDAVLRVAAAKLGDFQTLSTMTVPVYVHIIQDDQGANTATESQIIEQISVLNAAYKRAHVTFELQSIDLTVNSDWFDGVTPNSIAEYEMKQALHSGDSTSLNLYLAKPGKKLLGWATFPWDYASDPQTDGVVILYSSLPGGTAVPYAQGDTLTHEAGHWLGLLHTFQPTKSATDGCRGSGDSVTDTPAEKIAHFRCRRSDSCPRQSGMDPIHNFMDYTDDACLTEFSRGQMRRIASAWVQYRQ